ERKGENQFLYALPVVIATLSYATSANIVKRYLQQANPFAMSSAGFAFIGIPSLIYLLSTGFWHKSDEAFFLLSTGSIVGLSLFGTVLASVVFYWLIQKTDSLFGSLVAYLIPIVALMLGVWDGEIITLKHVGGMALILVGIYVINIKNPFGKFNFSRQ
ncbi:MAG: DMT family transporter, partial [Chitinophagales bacterium]